MRLGDSTGRPSSVNAVAPASASAAISVSSWPSWPLLIAAMSPTGTTASSRARSSRAPSTDAESTTGSVFGIARIDAVPARRGGLGAGANRLLVRPPGGPQVDVRIDERRRDDERASAGAGSSSVMTPSATVTRSDSSMP